MKSVWTKKIEAIKDRVIRDTSSLFEHEEDYYLQRIVKFLSYNYIAYESNGDRNKTLSIEEIFEKPNTWKIQLTIATNFISSKDNDEQRLTHSKSDNTEFMI